LIGGFSVLSATLAALLAGLFSGLYANYKNRGKLVGVSEAIYFTVIYELFAAGLTFLIVPDFQQALNMESKLRLPLIVGNVVTVAMYIYITKNLSEKRKMHEELKRLDQLHLVGEMAASISHEIRNPMTTVRGYLQYFSAKESLKPFASQFKLMIEELDRANQIITEYLSLAKNKSIDKKMANLTEIVQQIFPLLESNGRITGKNIILKLQDVPSLLLDEKEIRQLIFNLVLNGLEAMSSGGTVTIHTSVEDGNVVLAIQDEGCGISPDIISKIGTPFITNKDNGTGLGLAVCYHIVERHGAKMYFDTSGIGTTFYLLAPY
jgi:signal transduction histidine kinase